MTMKKILGLLLLAFFPLQIAAAFDFIPETDAQFAASQQARSEAFAAFQAGNLEVALAKMEDALTKRPGNTLLLGNIAFLAAETGNLQRAETAARSFAAAGQTPGTAIQNKLAEKLAPKIWQGIKTTFDANAVPIGDASVHAKVPISVKLIEGIAVTPEGRIFVSSVVSGAIYEISAGQTSPLVDAQDHSMGSFFGMAYNGTNKSLFVTYARVDQTPGTKAEEGRTGIAEFDVHSGALKNNWVLDGPTDTHQIADLVITHDQRVYASDATGKAVYMLNDASLVKVFDLPTAMSPQGLAELNGKLYLADYGRGIWRLDRALGTAILLSRNRTTNLIGIDGLTAHKGKLLAIQNGSNPQKVIALSLSADGKSVVGLDVVAQSLAGFDEPTLGASAVGGYYFVAGSQWPKFGPGETLRDGASLNPTTILRLP